MLFEIMAAALLTGGVVSVPFIYTKFKNLPEGKEVHDILLERQLERSRQELPPPPPSFPLPYHVMRKYLAIANTFPQNMALYKWLKQHPEHVEAIQLWNDFLTSTVKLNLIFPENTWEEEQHYLADHERRFFSVFVPELVQTYDLKHPDPLYHQRIQAICYTAHMKLIQSHDDRNDDRSRQSIEALELAAREIAALPTLPSLQGIPPVRIGEKVKEFPRF